MKKVPIKELREDLKEELKEELVPDSAILDEKKMGEELYHKLEIRRDIKDSLIVIVASVLYAVNVNVAGRCDRNLLASAAYLQNIFAYQCAIFIIQYTS